MAVTKRYTVPKFWSLRVKEKKYAVSPLPGAHGRDKCIPLGIALRDVLHVTRTMGEAKDVLNRGMVKINGAVRKHRGYPIGLMDVIEMNGDFYRVLPSRSGLSLFKTDANDAATKLSKIRNKTYVRKKKLQINFHDGTNMLVDNDDFRTSDVVVMDLNHKLIKDTIRFEKGTYAIVTDGHNMGVKGVVESIDKKLRTVVMGSGDRKLLVPIKYVFVLGRSQPVIKVGE